MNPLEKLYNYAPTLREQVREKLTSDLAAFSRRAWKEIEPKQLQWGWHHELICEHLQLCYERQILRLIITIPPRGLKSRLVSVFFPAWCWARDPALSFVLTSYSDSLSTELSVLRRNLLQSKWYQEMWPGKVQFASDQNQKAQYENRAHGQMIATSMTGTMLGKGADVLVVDDAMSPQQSFSDPTRESVNRDFDSTFRSRLNEPTRGVIIIICQRLHERDLVGHLLETEPGVWTHLSLPMEAERDEEIIFPVSGKIIKRKAGDLLHPGRFPKDWVSKQKQIGSYLWNSQYQQRPGALGGSIFKSAWFQTYDALPKKGQTILSLDTAYSTKKTADFSAASVWVAAEGKFYLAWVWRGRVEYPQLKKITEELCESWRPETVLVEEKASGQSLLQSLKQETSLPVIGFKVETDKVSRAHGVTALFESGRVFLPKSAVWLPDLVHELELFPAGAHDDQVDTLTMALTYLRRQQYDGGLGVIQLLKRYATVGWVNPPKPVAQPAPIDKPPVETRVNSSAAWKLKAPPCKACGSTATIFLGSEGGPIHCNQCQADDGVLPPAPIGSCCGNFLPQRLPTGQIRCGSCGAQPELSSQPRAVNFPKRGDYVPRGSKYVVDEYSQSPSSVRYRR